MVRPKGVWANLGWTLVTSVSLCFLTHITFVMKLLSGVLLQLAAWPDATGMKVVVFVRIWTLDSCPQEQSYINRKSWCGISFVRCSFRFSWPVTLTMLSVQHKLWLDSQSHKFEIFFHGKGHSEGLNHLCPDWRAVSTPHYIVGFMMVCAALVMISNWQVITVYV